MLSSCPAKIRVLLRQTFNLPARSRDMGPASRAAASPRGRCIGESGLRKAAKARSWGSTRGGRCAVCETDQEIPTSVHKHRDQTQGRWLSFRRSGEAGPECLGCQACRGNSLQLRGGPSVRRGCLPCTSLSPGLLFRVSSGSLVVCAHTCS